MSPEGIKDYEQDIRDAEEAIKELPKLLNYDFKLPDSYTSLNGGITIYLWRDQRVIRFTIAHDTLSRDVLEQKLRDVIGRFRLRAPHEIPTEPGVCLPHSFIADDGLAFYDIKNTFRLKAEPGVTYTMAVGDPLPNRDPIGLDVHIAAHPLFGGLLGGIAQGQITRRFGAEATKMGAFDAIIGGYEIRPDLSGKDSSTVYTLRSAYGGHRNPDPKSPTGNRFPFVTFEVNSYLKGIEPEIKTNPPDFDTARQTLTNIMKSMRWRGL